MNWLNSFWIAISTYSILPAPHIEWQQDNMHLSICFLPGVGIFIAGALILWHYLCLTFMVEAALFAAGAALLPLLLTGGIHMDGFMDTTDALASHQSRERKLEIMKDSHIGAFAVMGCTAYLLLSFGLYTALYNGASWGLIGISFILSRSLCALSIFTLPGARNDGMLYTLTGQVKNYKAATAMGLLSLFSAGAMLFIDFKIGIGAVLIALAVFFGYRRLAKKNFGGVTGDTSGFFIQVCELCLGLAIWIGGLL